MGKIVVVGSANIDLIVQTERVPKAGETVMGNDFTIAAGGKGANQAVAAARLGGEVTFVACVGADDFGTQAIEGYQKDGINTDYITPDETAPTGTALIIVDARGENRIVVVAGANGQLNYAQVVAAKSEIATTDVVLLQLETPAPVAAAAKLAQEHGRRVILNPAPARELPEELWGNISILTPNETELETLTGMNMNNTKDIEKAARKLLVRGPELVIVTMGAVGALIVTEQEAIPVASFAIKAVDTTAAGDAFNGALAVALARGDELIEAVRFANAAGALACTRLGAQPSLPTRDEVENLLRSVE